MMETTDLVAALEHANVLRHRNFDTSFESRVVRRDAAGGTTDDWEYLEEFRYVAFEDKLYLRRESYKRSGPDGSPGVVYRQENIWKEGAWWMRVDDDTGVMIDAFAAPTDMGNYGFIFNRLEGRFPSRASLAERVRDGQRLDGSIADGVLTYRLGAPNVGPDRARYTIRAGVEPSGNASRNS